MEPDILFNFALHASASTLSHSGAFDISKAPSSFAEAHAQSDYSVWWEAMDREKKSLEDMGAFEEADPPPGECAIRLKWVYAFKMDADGHNIPGKEKARVIAQGFNQHPGQYDETCALVVKMASIHIGLLFATSKFFSSTAKLLFSMQKSIILCMFVRYLDILFPILVRSCISLSHSMVFVNQPMNSICFYLSLLLSLGMVRCNANHGVFFGKWTSPPDSSVDMPVNGTPLVLYVPIHVDDGPAITNSPSLYAWFLRTLAHHLMIIDLGQCAKFLNILIICDQPGCHLWLSSHVYIAELLKEWNLMTCCPASTPFPTKLPDSSSPPNALPDISDVDLVPKYQCLVGCLLYLAIASRLDLPYYTMWLGQFNASPSCTHFLIAC